VKQPEGSLRERVRYSSLVDWPVYPRLRRTMEASTPAHIELLRLRPDKADAFDAKFGVGAAAKILGR
jgi:hypothetical protein